MSFGDEIRALSNQVSEMTNRLRTLEDKARAQFNAGGITAVNVGGREIKGYHLDDQTVGTDQIADGAITAIKLDGGGAPPASHALGGASHSADTLANLNTKVSDAVLDDHGASRPPTSHTHAKGDLTDATATPTADKIPIADGAAHLDGWVTLAGIGAASTSHTHPTRELTDITWLRPVTPYDPTPGLPGGPTTGDRYIALATANGWTLLNIYEYNGATWSHHTSVEGDCLYINGAGYYQYVGATWGVLLDGLYCADNDTRLSDTRTPTAGTDKVWVMGNCNTSITATGYLLMGTALMAYSSTNGHPMPRGGSITAISVTIIVTVKTSDGNAIFEARINNGVVFSVTIPITSTGTKTGYAVQAAGIDTFNAGDLLQMSVTYDGGLAATILKTVMLVEVTQ
jgi:hypothetical protein